MDPVAHTIDPVLGNAARPRPSGAAAEVHDLYRRLATCPSLTPGPEVNALFGQLVDLVVGLGPVEAATLLADPGIELIRPHLQRLCADGETELERFWSTRIATSPRPTEELARFPYLANYDELVRLEWSALAGVGSCPPERVAFIGAGPLPLSAVLLAGDHGVEVDTFDRDPGAVAQARALVAALGAPRLRVRRADALACPDLRRYDLVVLAALVGATAPAKHAAVARVHARMRPGAVLTARSAHAARTLLYPVLDLEAVAALDLLGVVHPFTRVVNSIVLARKRAGGGAPWPGS